jgi:hypothetical protein
VILKLIWCHVIILKLGNKYVYKQVDVVLYTENVGSTYQRSTYVCCLGLP